MSTELKVGDVVRLKSGGPLMLVRYMAVDAVDQMRCTCIWTDHGGFHEANLYPEDVESAPPADTGYAGPVGGTYKVPPKVLEVIDELMVALNSYVCTLKYMKASVNPEEWESHGDWDNLARRGMAAMSRAELLKEG